MKALKQIGLKAAAVVAIGAIALAAAKAQGVVHGDVANGKRLYLADGCFTCHGRVGQGGAYNTPAPILAHTAMPFDGFKGQIRNPINDMPAFPAAILSDKDIADIYAFVESLPGPRGPKDFPILNN